MRADEAAVNIFNKFAVGSVACKLSITDRLAFLDIARHEIELFQA